MNKTLKIGMGCGLGAFFGVAIANVWFLPYSILGLMLGIVAGGLSSAFVYAFEDIVHFAPIALRQVMGWKPKPVDWELVNLRIRIVGAIIGFGLSMVIVWFATGWIPYSILVVNFIFLACGLVGCLFATCPKGMIVEMLEVLEIPLSLKWNIVCAPFSATYYTFKGIIWCLNWLYRNRKFIVLFLLKLFILVGSEGLRCCFVDTAIAVAIGWALNLVSPLGLLFGGLIGVGIGVFHYKIVQMMPIVFRKEICS